MGPQLQMQDGELPQTWAGMVLFQTGAIKRLTSAPPRWVGMGNEAHCALLRQGGCLVPPGSMCHLQVSIHVPGPASTGDAFFHKSMAEAGIVHKDLCV